MTEAEEPPKIEPKKLPFSLKNDLTVRALFNLGIKEEELEIPNFAEIRSKNKNLELANKLYQRKIENRNNLIDKVVEERKKLQSEQDDQPKRLDGTLVKEKFDYERTNALIEQKNETNNKTLKRLAIHQLRHNYKKQKTEEKIDKCNQLTSNFTEKREQTLSRAYTAVQTRTFATVSRNEENPKLETELADDMQKHVERAQQKQTEVKQKYKQSRDDMDKHVEKGRVKSADLLNAKKEKTQAKIDSYEKMIQNKSEIIAQQKQKFTERGQAISEKATTMKNHNNKLLEDLTNSRKEYTESHLQRAQSVLEEQNTKKQEKIAEEKARLEKMTEAANKIFEKQIQKREDFRKTLETRDEKLADRINTLKNEKVNDLFEKAIQRDEKIQQARRNAASILNTTQAERSKSLLRNSGELSAVIKQRAKSELQLAAAEQDFGDKRRQLENALRDVADKSEEEQIRTLVKVLEISEEDAAEIVNTAKQPY